MERNRRRQNTKEKRTAIWKRCIAAAVAMVTVLTGLNYDGLANVFAKETSGYRIDVSYSEDKTSAVLTGNVGNVPAGTTLTAMTGADGTEYDPNSFQMTVTENGTYTYTLKYNVSVAETGQTVEQKETLEVTVDQIQAVKARTMSEPAAASNDSTAAAQQSSERTGGPSQNSEAATLLEEAPETVPLAELEEELAALADGGGSDEDQLEGASYGVYQYAYEERELDLMGGKTVPYMGGLFAENAPGYTESGFTRIYKEASLVIVQEDIDAYAEIAITGLYPYNLQAGSGPEQWYYTTAENTEGSDSGYGTIQVGYRIPDNAQVRLYYEVSHNAQTSVTLQTNSTGIDIGEFEFKVKNTQMGDVPFSVTAYPTERVPVEFKMPAALSNMTVTITNVQGEELAKFQTDDLSGSGLKDEGSRIYSGVFVMPNSPASIAISGTVNSGNKWFTAFTSMDVDPGMLGSTYPRSLGMSRTYTTAITGQTLNAPSYSDRRGYYYDLYWKEWRQPGYGLTGYVSGGVPYIHTQRIAGVKPSGNSNWGSSETVRAGQKSDTSDGSGTVAVKVSNDANAASFTAPVRNFPAGGKVTVRFETAIRNTDTTQHWNVVPNTLAVDVYPENGTFSTANFIRENFDLPRSAGSKVTYNLETGGTVTIECKTYNGQNQYQNPRENANGHPRRFQDGYMFSTEFTSTSPINDGRYLTAGDAPSNFTGVVSGMSWFAYEVTVQGVYNDFKLYQNSTSGAHKNAILQFDETAKDAVILDSDYEQMIGSGASTNENDMVKNGVRSYTYLKMSQGDARGMFRTLEMPFTFRTFMKPGGVSGEPYSNIILALTIRQGYSPPSVSQTSGSGVEVQSMGYSGGVHKYRIILSGRDGTDLPSVITVSSKAVEFRAQFYENGNLNPGVLYKLGYGEDQSRNYVIVPPKTVLDRYPDLQYFQVYLVKTDGTTANNGELQITNLEGGNQWHTGDIINYDDVYKQALNKGFLEANRDFYRLEIRPVEGAEGSGRTDGTYLISEQSSFSSGDIYQDNSFTQSYEGTVQAMKGAEVVVVGYKDQILDEVSHKHFKLGLRSTTNGTLSDTGAVVAKLYYLSAVRASIDAANVGQLQSDGDALAKINEWNRVNANTLYTSVNNESHFVNYADIYAYLKGKDEGFAGFKIKNVTTGELYNYKLPEENGVNLHLIGAGSGIYGYTQDPALWEMLFGDSGESRGQLVLVPTYEEDSKIVSDLTSGAISISSSADKESITDQSVEMEASFYYTGDKTTAYTGLKFAVTKQEFQRNATTGEIDTSQQTAAGRDPGQRNKLVAYGDITQAADGATNVTVNGPYGTSGGNNKITFASWEENEAVQSFTLGLNIGVNNLTYQWDHDAVYTIHMWNDGNEPGNINDNLSVWAGGNEGAWSEDSDTNVTNNFLTASPLKIPGVSATTKVYPKKVVTTGEAISHTEGTEESATPGDGNGIQEYENVNLTTAFTIDSKYPIDLQLKTEEEILAAAGGTSTAGTADERAKARIHTALLKRNPPGAQSAADTDPDWEAWIYDTTTTNSGRQSSNADKVRRTVFESANGNTQVKVTYELVNQGTSLNWRWEDKAQYELFAWNDTNESGISLTGGESVIQTSLESALNKKSGTAYSKVPSSIYEINLAWLEPTYYVYIPTGIIMTDDGDNKDGSGASADDWAGVEVTVRYKDSSEGNDADTQPVVDVSVSDSVTLASTTDGNKVLTANVYDSNGDLMPASGGKVAIGQLKHNTSGTGEQTVTPVPSLTYYLNANKTGITSVKGEIFTGKQTFDLTLQNYQRYIQNP